MGPIPPEDTMLEPQRPGRTRIWGLTAALGLAPVFASAQPGGPPSPAPGFTAAQVEAGSVAYVRYCAACHGAALEGQHLIPALRGTRFDRTWRGRTAEALMFHLRRMPPAPADASGRPGDDTYTDLLAYLLSENGLVPGERALPSTMTALAGFVIPRGDAAETDPDAPVSAGADSPRLAGLGAVSDTLLREPPAADWLQWGRTYDGHSFSPLDRITRNNVSGLRLAWRTPLRNGTSMPMPLAHDGVLFLQTIPDTVLALDGATGDILWRHRFEPAEGSTKKMGLALHDDRVLVPASGLRLRALDARTGELVWDHEIALNHPAATRDRYQLRSAPLVVGDVVIQGVTASFAPGGGFIVALDLDSGDEIWRFSTIARPDTAEGASWNGLPLEARSGGSVWHQGTYDPDLHLVYFGVAPTYDTGPLLQPSGEPSVTRDALYTNCTIALDPDTGELVWYYQHVANDQWDLDWVFERQIVETMVEGRRRKVVMNAGKMAILDALDAATGEYLFSIDAGTQNVVTAIDPETGAKTIDPDQWPDPDRAIVVCPGVSGARAWPPTSYSERTGLLYVPLTEWCNRMGPEGFRLLTSGVGLSAADHPDAADGTMGRVQAFDIAAGTLAWTHDLAAPVSTGTLATAGGVVFAGDLDPSLKAFDDATGELLWQAALDDLPSSSLMTYAVDDAQYVAVVVGLRNNHVSDLSRRYQAVRERAGDPDAAPPEGGAAIWVFSR